MAGGPPPPPKGRTRSKAQCGDRFHELVQSGLVPLCFCSRRCSFPQPFLPRLGEHCRAGSSQPPLCSVTLTRVTDCLLPQEASRGPGQHRLRFTRRATGHDRSCGIHQFQSFCRRLLHEEVGLGKEVGTRSQLWTIQTGDSEPISIHFIDTTHTKGQFTQEDSVEGRGPGRGLGRLWRISSRGNRPSLSQGPLTTPGVVTGLTTSSLKKNMLL